MERASTTIVIVSFDPQNPRGAQRPSTPPPTPSSASKPGNYIPPQPVNAGSGPPRNLLIGGAILLGLVVVLLAALAFGLPHDGASTPAPGSPLASQSAAVGTRSPSSSFVPSSLAPTAAVSLLPPTFVGSPPAGFDAFLLHVPEAVRATCQPAESSDQSVLFSADCATPDGIAATYDQYADAASMDAAYQAAFTAQQIDPDTGSCDVHTTWPAESAYQVEGQPAGRRLCADVQGSPTVLWTDERLTIYSSATGADPVRLIQFWTSEAGPVQ